MTTEFIKEANRIKDRLRDAPDKEAIEQIADEERETVLKFAADKELAPLAKQIVNLKSYMLHVELPAREKRRNS